jgi:L(+)-tartrate dehydratase beta subunit
MECRAKHVALPLTDAAVRDLAVGDLVYLTGRIFTGRVRFYARVVTQGIAPPIDIATQCNVQFHCSPAVRREDSGRYTISAVTATASFRFAKYLEPMFAQHGLKAVIGKGGMAPDLYTRVFAPHGAVYLSTIGYGLGALYGRSIEEVETVYWAEEFGLAQAMWIIRVKDFGPLIVDGDTQGRSLQADMQARIRPTFDALLARYPRPTLKRTGEVRNPIEEVV